MRLLFSHMCNLNTLGMTAERLRGRGYLGTPTQLSRAISALPILGKRQRLTIPKHSAISIHIERMTQRIERRIQYGVVVAPNSRR